MAASDPATDVATPTGVLQGVAAFGWDGAAWQPAGRAGPGVGTPTGVLRGVAPFYWNGVGWQPSGLAQPGVATPSGVLDGVAVYAWSGSAWTPAGGQPGVATPSGSLRGVAAFSWDGAAWQPAGQAGPSVATPYGVLDGVALFNWNGTAWAAEQGPALDLSFMTAGTLPPGVTISRASIGTYFDVTGTLQTAANNSPRWEYDPVTHALRGLLVEESRVNYLLNSAAPVSQTTVSIPVGTYMFWMVGSGSATVAAGTAAGSGFGSASAATPLVFTTTSVGNVIVTLSGSVTRFQLELVGTNVYPSSFIPTTGAAVTRQPDVVSIPVTGWLGPDPHTGTLLLEAMRLTAPVTGSGPFILNLVNSAAAGDSVGLGLLNTNFISMRNASIGDPSSSYTQSVAPNPAPLPFKAAHSFTPGTQLCSVGGASPVALSRPTIAGSTPDVLVLGGQVTTTAGNRLMGYLRRVAYWPRALEAGELQAVTT